MGRAEKDIHVVPVRLDEPGEASRAEALLRAYPFKRYRRYVSDEEVLGRLHLWRLQEAEGSDGVNLVAVDGSGGDLGFLSASSLPWDSGYFGAPCASIEQLAVRDPLAPASIAVRRRLLEEGLARLTAAGVRFVTCKVSTEDIFAPRVLARTGFDLTATNVQHVWAGDGPHRGPARIPSGVAVRLWKESDLHPLAELARRAYSLTRFHGDANIPRETSDELQATWLVNCCRGLADRVAVAELDGEILGFITCRVESLEKYGVDRRVGVIDLVGVAAPGRSRGIGTALMSDALAWFRERVDAVEVETQVANRAALNFYARMGFGIASSEYCLHRWRAR